MIKLMHVMFGMFVFGSLAYLCNLSRKRKHLGCKSAFDYTYSLGYGNVGDWAVRSSEQTHTHRMALRSSHRTKPSRIYPV